MSLQLNTMQIAFLTAGLRAMTDLLPCFNIIKSRDQLVFTHFLRHI